MNLKNYYYYFKEALTPRLCQQIIDYGKQHTAEMAITGGVSRGENSYKKDGKLKKYVEKNIQVILY